MTTTVNRKPRRSQSRRNRQARRPERWTDAFFVYAQGTVEAGKQQLAVNLTPEQWANIKNTLRAGHVIGFVANYEEALPLIVEVTRICDFAIAVVYDEDEMMLYVSRKQGARDTESR